MPRILAGSLRGQSLRVPKNVTRPTSSRVREALFDLLEHSPELSEGPRHWQEGGRVADLFAGSGALGFEAVSRGAGSVTFVEADQGACNVLRDNVQRLGLGRSCRVLRGRLPNAVSRLKEPLDLVFMDPPYAKWREAGAVAAKLLSTGLLSEEALVVVEVPAKEVFARREVRWPPWDRDGALDPVFARRWGDTGVVIFRFVGYRHLVGTE